MLDALAAAGCFGTAIYLATVHSLKFWFWSWLIYGFFEVLMATTKGTSIIQEYGLKLLRVALIASTLK